MANQCHEVVMKQSNVNATHGIMTLYNVQISTCPESGWYCPGNVRMCWYLLVVMCNVTAECGRNMPINVMWGVLPRRLALRCQLCMRHLHLPDPRYHHKPLLLQPAHLLRHCFHFPAFSPPPVARQCAAIARSFNSPSVHVR